MRRLAAQLSVAHGGSRAAAAWAPFKALLDGEGAGREAVEGKLADSVSRARAEQIVSGAVEAIRAARHIRERCQDR